MPTIENSIVNADSLEFCAQVVRVQAVRLNAIKTKHRGIASTRNRAHTELQQGNVQEQHNTLQIYQLYTLSVLDLTPVLF